MSDVQGNIPPAMPTHGCQVVISGEALVELLGVNGQLNNAVFNPNTGNITFVFTGDEEHFPPLEGQFPDLCDANYLRVVVPDKILRLTDSKGNTYIHRTLEGDAEEETDNE